MASEHAIVGTQLTYALRTLLPGRKSESQWMDESEGPDAVGAGRDVVRVSMQILISLVLIAAGIWLLVAADTGNDVTKLAAGWIGVVAGYWLR